MRRAEPGLLSAWGLGLRIGALPTGPQNAITDVEGVRVGHCTVTDRADSAVQTGVTVVVPHEGNLFREKLVAAVHVINGFGKSVGLLQVEELGQLESPIALTNTLSVPAVTEGLLDRLLAESSGDRHDHRLRERGRDRSATTASSTTSAVATCGASMWRRRWRTRLRVSYRAPSEPAAACRPTGSRAASARASARRRLAGLHRHGRDARAREPRPSVGARRRRPACRRRAGARAAGRPGPAGRRLRHRGGRDRCAPLRAPARPGAPPCTGGHRPHREQRGIGERRDRASASRRRPASRTPAGGRRSRWRCCGRMVP